jgi:hypothetical protein
VDPALYFAAERSSTSPSLRCEEGSSRRLERDWKPGLKKEFRQLDAKGAMSANGLLSSAFVIRTVHQRQLFRVEGECKAALWGRKRRQCLARRNVDLDEDVRGTERERDESRRRAIYLAVLREAGTGKQVTPS